MPNTITGPRLLGRIALGILLVEQRTASPTNKRSIQISFQTTGPLRGVLATLCATAKRTCGATSARPAYHHCRPPWRCLPDAIGRFRMRLADRQEEPAIPCGNKRPYTYNGFTVARYRTATSSGTWASYLAESGQQSCVNNKTSIIFARQPNIAETTLTQVRHSGRHV
jgi:hypothetical protein